MTGPEPRGPRPTRDSAGNSWTVTACSAEPGRLSEGPRWDAGRSELLWVDVLAGRLHRARLDADRLLEVLQTFQIHGPLGAAAPPPAAATCWPPVPASCTSMMRARPQLAQPEAGVPTSG